MKKIQFKEEAPLSQEKKRPGLKKKVFLISAGLALLISVFLVVFLVLPLLSLKDRAFGLGDEIKKISVFLESQDFKAAVDQIEVINENFEKIKGDYQKLVWLKPLPYFGKFYRDGSHFIEGGFYLLEAAGVAGKAMEPYYDLLGLEPTSSDQPVKDQPSTAEERLVLLLDTLDMISPQFEAIGEKLEKAGKEISQVDPDRYPEELFGKKIRGGLVNLIDSVESTTKLVTEIKPMISYLKPLLGIPDKKTYFLLFQNDTELRPSGGFMTAYAFLSVHNGKFTPLASHDIYTLDNQFGNRLKAPEPILNYLPNINYWHLRDMNLSPDFAKSMETFWENYQKIPGARQVDGIIAVDTQILTEILKVLGQIGVSGWGNFSGEIDPRCNCPQVVYELEKYADQPVSTWREERKGIIGPLMHSILGNIMGSPRKKWPEFLNVFFEAIKEKNILFYFFDDDLQLSIEALNAGGRIDEFEGDYFHLSDCNFGGAKSNMYIRQSVVQEIKIDNDGFPVKTVTIDYKNPAPPSDCNLERGNLCLNGFYRNWFRLFVPEGSELISSSGSEVEIKSYEELGKTVFEGFYGKTPSTSLKPEGKLKLTFEYRLPFRLDKGSTFNLLIQKQPGALNHQYEVRFDDQVEEFELDSDKKLYFRF